tara:strand:+ start:25313 stop:26233 length:921 start_codon:yes stop_codon:yes gene_type:complete
MAAFKQFNAQDILISPLEVNKNFSFQGDSELTASNVGIDRFYGTNINITGSGGTGYITPLSQSSVYNSAKELYYSNYISSSYGDSITTASVILGSNPSGDVLVGPNSSRGRYYNYLNTTLTQSRSFPTSSDEHILTWSIPSKLYGDFIQPESFILEFNNIGGAVNAEITDDGNGNLLSASVNVGNIIYQHGIAILTQQEFESQSLEVMYSSSNVTCSFSSSFEILETQYKCTITEEEFNYSLNNSVISGSTGNTLYDYATSSFFEPYITTVGMYNEQYELLAVGKLAQPLPSSRTTDTTILVNIDR